MHSQCKWIFAQLKERNHLEYRFELSKNRFFCVRWLILQDSSERSCACVLNLRLKIRLRSPNQPVRKSQRKFNKILFCCCIPLQHLCTKNPAWCKRRFWGHHLVNSGDSQWDTMFLLFHIIYKRKQNTVSQLPQLGILHWINLACRVKAQQRMMEHKLLFFVLILRIQVFSLSSGPRPPHFAPSGL